MAELILQLRVDPVTGKKDVVIDYGSDGDALPMEHEEEHRRWVDALLEGGTLAAAELGRIVIRRDGEETALDPELDPEAAAREAIGVDT